MTRMIKRIKRITAILLIVALTLSLLPENIVSAKENKVITQQTTEAQTAAAQTAAAQTAAAQTTTQTTEAQTAAAQTAAAQTAAAQTATQTTATQTTAEQTTAAQTTAAQTAAAQTSEVQTATQTTAAQTTTSQTTTSQTSVEQASEKPYILSELVDKRELYTKHFLMSDKSIMAATYNQPIHTVVNGNYVDIDNSFNSKIDDSKPVLENNINTNSFNNNIDDKVSVLENKTIKNSLNLNIDIRQSVLENKINALKTRFAKKANKNKLASIEYQGYKINWSMPNANTVSAETTDSSKEKEKKDTKLDDKLLLSNITSKVTYKDILKNVDLNYVVKNNNIKESLILKNKNVNKKFIFNYEIGNLSYRVLENKNIEIYDKNKSNQTIFTIEKLFMFDSQKKYSEDIEMKVEKNNKGITVTVIPSKEFLNAKDTVYPVTIDPNISTSINAANIFDNDMTRSADYYCNYLADTFWVGSNEYDAYRGLLKFNELPELGSSDYIVDARLFLNVFKDSTANSGTQVDIHKLTEEVDTRYAMWADVDNKYDSTITDYQIYNGQGLSFDITKLATEWYNGQNYGLMLNVHDETQNNGEIHFVSSDYADDAEARPSCLIEYRDTTGLESYWSYHSESVGRATTTYVNDATGELTMQHIDFSENGNRQPLVLSRTFNMSNLNDEAEVGVRSGIGWRMNINQNLRWEYISDIVYNIYTDADGTEHYFCEDDDWYDEDGLGFKLDFKEGYYQIADKGGNFIRFRDAGGKIYLYAIEDANKNTITIDYSNGDYSRPSKVTDGASRSTVLGYNQLGRLSTISDPAGRTTRFEYSAGAPGADPFFLQKIIYPDGEYTQFNYVFPAGDKYIRVGSSDGTAINYTINGNLKTYNATLYGNDGQSNELYTIDKKSNNVTRYNYPNGLYEDYQFDNWARLTCVKNSEGYAQYSEYANTVGSSPTNNKTTIASNVQKSVTNYFINGNAEEDYQDLWCQEGWNGYSGASANRVDSVAMQGKYSWRVTKLSTNGYYHNRQFFDLEKNKTYTFSAYIKTDIVSSNKDAGAKIYVNYHNNDGSQTNVQSVAVQNTGSEWQRVSVTFTNQNYANRVYFFIGITPGASGTAYFDNLQVEDGDTMNRYNCIENGSFERGTYNVECNGNTEVVGNDGLIGAGNNAFRVNGDSALSNNNAKITTFLYIPANTNIVIGAWARANAAPMYGKDIKDENGKVTGNERLFGIEAEIYYTDGASYRQCLKFNDALSVNDWQYLSGVINLSYEGNPSTNKTVSNITLNAIYQGQVNYADFDMLSMYVEEFGQTFSYDDNGNLKSSADIAKQAGTFDYSNNNLTKMLSPTGTSYEYTYDAKKNVKSAVTSEGVRCQINYDNFGNPINTTIQSDVQSTSLSNGNVYYIRNKWSGKYLDSAHGIYIGKNIIQTTFAKSASQMWKAESTGDGYFKFIPQNMPEYALDVNECSPENGTSIQLWDRLETDEQKFKIKVNTDGSYAILTKASSCSGGLDVFNAYITDGASVGQWTYGTDGMYPNQAWFFEEVPEDEKVLTSVADTASELNGKVIYLYNKNSNKVVQVCGNLDNNGALVKQYDKKIDSGMKWRIQNAGGGYVYFVSMCSSSGRVLGFPNSNINTAVQLRNNDGSDLVKFKIIKNTNGSYNIQSKAANGLSLAVLNATQANDGSVIEFPYASAGLGREWYFQSGSYEWSDTPQANKNYYIKSGFNSQFFDIPTKEDNIGTVLTQYQFIGENNQKFNLIDCSNGYFKMQPLHSADGKVIELKIENGSYNLKLNTSGTSALQQFKFVKNSNGTYKIVNKQAGDNYVIEIPNDTNTFSEPLKMAYNTSANSNQNQQWVLEEISDRITSSATYTNDGNYLSTTTDSRGKKTTYNYNTKKGTLDSVVNANSVATNYACDPNNDALTAVAQSGVRVDYTYNKDKINTITTGNNNVYSFGYDNFNRNTTVKVGTQLLVTNIYDKRGLMTQSTYGNGQTVGYTYDILDRVKEKKYNDVIKATYKYDNDGNVTKTTDGFTNTTTDFTYDAINRLMNASTRSNGQIIHTIKFKYDDKNRVSDFTNTVAGINTKTAYEYSNTSLINGVSTTQGTLKLSQNYVYDNLTRITQKNITLNGSSQYKTTYSYLQGATAGTTTTLVDTITNNGTALKYEYDNLGNITKIYEKGVLKSSYTYDNLNQLKTETRNGITITYSYDLGGNITSKTTTTATGSTTINYAYGNANWKDLLTSYNGQSITYDAIGNPLTYGSGTTFTWQNGRRLATLSKSGMNAAYTYNVDGIRTKKVVNGVTTDYYLNGSNIVTRISGADRLDFAYDDNGNVYGFTYNNKTYAYVKNAQNDIIGIVDASGAAVVTYEYDAWGNILNVTGSDTNLGKLNPFRYRGYYYDVESGLFYVGSRYYNPEWGRFINADGLVSTGQGLQGNNMFAYCGNNPVNNMDPSGSKFISISIKNKKTDTYDFMPAKQTMPPYADHPEVIEQPTSTSPQGVEFIANYEGGFQEIPYDDGYGNPTIGYGHLITKDESFTSITKDQALNLLSSDLSGFEKSVTEYSNSIAIVWDQNQYDAFVDLAFNAGNNYKGVMDDIMSGMDPYLAFAQVIYAGGKKSLGLYRRRMDEADMFSNGTYNRTNRGW